MLVSPCSRDPEILSIAELGRYALRTYLSKQEWMIEGCTVCCSPFSMNAFMSPFFQQLNHIQCTPYYDVDLC